MSFLSSAYISENHRDSEPADPRLVAYNWDKTPFDSDYAWSLADIPEEPDLDDGKAEIWASQF